jgi:hypothetical protein
MSDFEKRSKANVIVWLVAALIGGFISANFMGCAATRKIEIQYKNVMVAIDLDKGIE